MSKDNFGLFEHHQLDIAKQKEADAIIKVMEQSVEKLTHAYDVIMDYQQELENLAELNYERSLTAEERDIQIALQEGIRDINEAIKDANINSQLQQYFEKLKLIV